MRCGRDDFGLRWAKDTRKGCPYASAGIVGAALAAALLDRAPAVFWFSTVKPIRSFGAVWKWQPEIFQTKFGTKENIQ